jgi:hypothetical protein
MTQIRQKFSDCRSITTQTMRDGSVTKIELGR